MTNEEIDEQIKYLNDRVIPYLLKYYKELRISDSEIQKKLDALLEEITRLKNLKK
ncbi:hypothetical protein [Parabacteroides pacaensis]|uniref:hypothetical protein n=1 Tax=Parabacteroides pacaensis TaxID=2086575 RepID=UPI00131B01EE|nr:hypothetical protein [Parabacteroides pacaensis]